jgi:hypothetical protein
MTPASIRATPRPQFTPVAAWVLVAAFLNVAGWLLSALGCLNWIGYSVICGLGLLGLGWWWKRNPPRWSPGFRASRLRWRFRQGLPLAFGLLAGLAILGGAVHAPNNYDALAYRVPRVLHWLAEGQWHWIHTDFHRLNTRGCGIEWVSAPLLAFTGTDRLLFLANAVSFALLPGLCFSLLTQLGVRKRVAWSWMWILPTGYCFVLQAGSIANDLFGATLGMAAMDFALRAARNRDVRAAWLAILAAAVMTASKSFNLLLLPAWGLALLPALPLLWRRPIATALVSTLALMASLVPTAILNQHYCDDWTGMKAEPVNLGTGAPMLHLGANVAMVTLHNFTPTFFPMAGIWNRWMDRIIPTSLAEPLRLHFEDAGARFQLGEMQMEEAAGLGFGVSILLLTVLIQRPRMPSCRGRNWLGVLMNPVNLVPLCVWAVTLYFLSQSGLGCPARYLAPWYVLLVAPLLRTARASELVRRTWWRGLAVAMIALAILLIIATPARPLFPAQTLLDAWESRQGESGWLKRARTVYAVYGGRSDGFTPVRAVLPEGLRTLGLVTFDDPETSLWRPFGSRRVVHVTREDGAASLRERGVEYVLLSEYVLSGHQQRTLSDWLDQYDAEWVTSLELSLRATRGPTPWHLVRLRPGRPDVAGRAD